jgi:hypothetical protein
MDERKGMAEGELRRKERKEREGKDGEMNCEEN